MNIIIMKIQMNGMQKHGTIEINSRIKKLMNELQHELSLFCKIADKNDELWMKIINETEIKQNCSK